MELPISCFVVVVVVFCLYDVFLVYIYFLPVIFQVLVLY